MKCEARPHFVFFTNRRALLYNLDASLLENTDRIRKNSAGRVRILIYEWRGRLRT